MPSFPLFFFYLRKFYLRKQLVVKILDRFVLDSILSKNGELENLDRKFRTFTKLSQNFHKTFTKLSQNFHKTFTKLSQKPLDKSLKMCYNSIRKGQGKVLKTRKGKSMKMIEILAIMTNAAMTGNKNELPECFAHPVLGRYASTLYDAIEDNYISEIFQTIENAAYAAKMEYPLYE